MPQFFAIRVICIVLGMLVFSNQSNAMQHSIGVETNRLRLVQWLIDHKIAIAIAVPHVYWCVCGV